MPTDQRPTQAMNPFTLETWTGVRPAWEQPWLELAERVLGLKRLATVYASLVPKMLTPEAFAEAALNGLQVNWSESPEFGMELRRLKGPVLVVANHPFGAIEALWLMRWLGRSGRDYRVLANDWLGALPELRPRLLFVNVLHRDADARQANTRAMRQASIWLKQGGVLVVFPAGEVANLAWGGIRAVEGPWSHHIIRLALRYNTSVLPVHFPGQNGAVFHVLGLLHPRLRTLYLAREAARPGRQLRVAVGAPLAPNDLATLAPPDQLAPALRAHTLRLIPKMPATVADSPHATLDLLPPAETLVREVMSLSARGRVLVSEGRLCVLWFRAIEAPALMRAVAVGRERAFRDAGEGSGKSRDEDVFDRDYTQIVLWDAEAQAVAGAYRAVVASGRWHKHGADGLYTTTLFHISQGLASELEDALELGRSYVGGPWQRQALPLMLLWRGVGAYALRIARCRRLIGCVSISPEFHTHTQRLILRFLSARAEEAGRTGMARPYNAPTDLLGGCGGPRPSDLKGLERWVRIFEQGHRSMPPLLKHYLTLGAEVLAFNRDELFNGTVDALILLDLRRAPERLLHRYLDPHDLARLIQTDTVSMGLMSTPACAL